VGDGARAAIGVIGGSGLARLLDEPRELAVATPFGPTSGPVTLGRLAGRRVAFLQRHGPHHTLPPHRIPYRANVWALASLGVRALVSSSAVGGLREDYPPGAFVVPDQLLDVTSGRTGTFFDGPHVEHLAAPDPFDPELRAAAIAALEHEGVPLRSTGTTVVIDGPRFATRAESRWYAAAGGDTVNMTLAPETPLALELRMGVVNCSFVTDSDSVVAAGHEDGVTAELVFARLASAQPVLRRALAAIVDRIPPDFSSTVGTGPDAVAEVLARPVQG
jgi:5'-methylthioadenosine phosphorylase